jgi:hypothetical protein
MKLTTVTIGLTCTVSLPDYCNVKPSIAITVELAPDDDLKRTVAALDASCRAYIEASIDDALEHEGESPRFYTGPFYHAHRWDQARAIIVFNADVDINALPGDWRTVTPQPVRKPAAMRRASYIAKNLRYEVWDWADLGSEIALEWWNARTWYVAYALHRYLDHWTHEPAQVVIIPYLHDGWELDGALRYIEDTNLRNRPRQLDEILQLIPSMPWTISETEVHLHTIVADWQAANPRPPADPQASDHEADYNALPDPDDERDTDPDAEDPDIYALDEQPGP